ncbi:auxin-responsive protein SAUR76-like [Curcuma longa]|uniref:auxin-responsive protein SAUR76-like n=1 Tax=Curcuma longa TaxID=136217 RepID=UPI003D9F9EF2
MAKGGGGKLSKLKCMIKRWNSSGRITGSTSGGESASAAGASSRSQDGDGWVHSSSASSFRGDEVPPGFHPVYVGKSRRRYLVSAGLIGHPLFQVLVERCRDDAGAGAAMVVVGCEVVLFEHLLWMLENAEPQPESLDELVEFYAC